MESGSERGLKEQNEPWNMEAQMVWLTLKALCLTHNEHITRDEMGFYWKKQTERCVTVPNPSTQMDCATIKHVSVGLVHHKAEKEPVYTGHVCFVVKKI